MPFSVQYRVLFHDTMEDGDDGGALVATHFTRPVDFPRALEALWDLGARRFIDCGRPLVRRFVERILDGGCYAGCVDRQREEKGGGPSPPPSLG